MTSLMFVLMMQYVISMKAGLVNHVQGGVNIEATQNLVAGAPVKTGPDGFAEILLNPGSYLRLGENSEAVLDSIELRNIAVRIVSGAAVIEAVGFDKRFPMKVTSGTLAVEIIKDGIYTFSDGKVTIVEGVLRAVDNQKAVFKKGRQVSKNGGYSALKVKKGDLTPVETWSRDRSKLIAVVNGNIARSLRGTSSSVAVPWDGWVWVPGFGGYTFMPGDAFRSPYGYQYQTLTGINNGFGFGSNTGGEINATNSPGESVSGSSLPAPTPNVVSEGNSEAEPASPSDGLSVP